jgi:hypothetical protein
MTSRSLILTLALMAATAVGRAAETPPAAPAGTPPAATNGIPDTTRGAGTTAESAPGAKAKAKVKAKATPPCPTTGTHIQPKPGQPCPAVGPTRSYDQKDLESTGEPDVGAALKKLDPIFH